MTERTENAKLAVITGASRGIGAATARALASRGFYVLAGVRGDSDADEIRADGIEPVILDITVPEHVHALADRVHNDPFGRPLHVLINNAGVAINVPIEVYPLDDWRRLFEVNFFGHMAMTQALLPSLIENQGRIVNVSSAGGKAAMATYGPYAATKFSLEAVSDALRRETAQTGLKVIVIEPGPVLTDMANRASATARTFVSSLTPVQSKRYGNLIKAVAAQTAAFTRKGVPAEAVASVIAKAVTVEKPRTRYTVSREAAIMVGMARLLPDRALDRIFDMALRSYTPK